MCLLDELDLRVDGLLGFFLPLVINDLLLLEQVAAVGVNGHDQGAELLHIAAPQGFRHTQLIPVMLLNLQHFGSGNHGAASREYAVNSAELLAGPLGVGTHAALAHDDADAGVLHELVLELFHAHGGGGAYGDHLVVILGAFDLADDGACVEDGLVADVVGQLPAVLDEPAVGNVPAGHEVAVQPDDVANVDVSQVFRADRGNENLFNRRLSRRWGLSGARENTPPKAWRHSFPLCGTILCSPKNPRATPHNGNCGLRQIFCPNRAV